MLTQIGDRSEPARRHPAQRPEHTNAPRRAGKTVSRDEGKKSKRQVRAEAPDHTCSHRGRTREENATKPAPVQPVNNALGRPMSPMPLPVTEEPVTDGGSTEGKKPIILGMPLDSTDDARPKAPSAPSPCLEICSLSTSPLSAVPSLHEN